MSIGDMNSARWFESVTTVLFSCPLEMAAHYFRSLFLSVSCHDKDRNSVPSVRHNWHVTVCVGELVTSPAFECGLGALSIWFCFWQEALSILRSSHRSLLQMARHLLLFLLLLLNVFHSCFVFFTLPSKSLLVSFQFLLHIFFLLFALISLQCYWALPRYFSQQQPTCCMATALTNLPHQLVWLHQIMSFSQPNLLQSSHSHCM